MMMRYRSYIQYNVIYMCIHKSCYTKSMLTKFLKKEQQFFFCVYKVFDFEPEAPNKYIIAYQLTNKDQNLS